MSLKPRLSSLLILTLSLGIVLEFPHSTHTKWPRSVRSQTVEAVEEEPPQSEREQLFERGEEHYDRGEWNQALELFQQVLVLDRQRGDRLEEGITLYSIGSVYRQLQQYDRAEHSYLQSLAIDRELDDRAGEAATLSALSDLYHDWEKYSQAEQYYSQALGIYRELGDRSAEANLLNNLGLLYDHWDKLEEARSHSEQALTIYRELGDRSRESITLYNLARLYFKRADYPRAEPYYQQGLAIARELDNRRQQANFLTRLGELYHNWREYDRAQQSYERALALYRELGDRHAEASRLYDLGSVYNSRREYDRAAPYLERALALYRELDDRPGETWSLGMLGQLYSNRGAYDRAKSYLEQALNLNRERGDRREEAANLRNLGEIAQKQGEYARAGQYYTDTLTIYRELDDRLWQAATLNDLGSLALNVGEFESAEQSYQQALAISRDVGDREAVGTVLNNLGRVYESLGHYSTARSHYEQALEIYRGLGSRGGVATILNNLGVIDQQQGEYAKAEQYLQEALAIHRQVGNRPIEGTTLNNLGWVYQGLKQYDRAEQYYLDALAIHRESGDRPQQGISLHNLGELYRDRGDYPQAESRLFEAIELREQLRPGLSDGQKVALFERQKNSYELLQQVLVMQDKTDRALEIAERGRARAFVELVAENFADRLNVEREITPPNIDEIRTIARDLDATLVQYSRIARLFEIDGRRQWRESELYIWVVQPTGEITFRRSNLTPLWREQNTSLDTLIYQSRCFDDWACRSELRIDRRGNRLPEVIGSRNLRLFNLQAQSSGTQAPPEWEVTYDELKQLHELLIDPIADLLPTDPNEHVVFIPQDSLFLLPFPALIDADGRYLIEKYAISTAPSIQILDLTHRRGQKWEEKARTQGGEAIVVGNPQMPRVSEGIGQRSLQLAPLPYAELEAREIARVLDVNPLLGQQATETAVVAKMQGSRIIHLATHGSFDPNRALDSWIALTPSGNEDGLLTAAEIFELNLDAELVVLSACETGRGKITGDGVIGLSRSLISAGVASVLVSLWSVPDDTTAVLMGEFYRHWRQSGDKAQALRQAMLATIAVDPNPYGWAAFTAIGQMR
ncbi:CHAT domain-containing protein [Oxynema aestuarii]|uniref:Tetratricopeptide repeat protein n=1 Tax=Oxynema aestuarii AP17 TaxID=2064643 RepID=A0A6H1TSX6_9CYAN|nr:tetratricopeptide repeat protein [Oxynema aestuarii]QIZ69545.1 tetratricopeptide repeat protein [Oxynema aestuarii AP17]